MCRKLKTNEATKQIPIVFITAKEEKESVIEAFRAGGVDYIQKPYAPSTASQTPARP